MAKTGVVKFFNDEKGFGFIVQDDGSPDLFAHRNQIADGQNLVENDRVHYDEAYDERKGKTMADNVTGGSGGPAGESGGGYGGGKGYGGGGKGYGGGGRSFGGGGGFRKGSGKGYGDGGGKGATSMAKTGTVKYFHDDKGFGFILQDDGSPDLFVHRNQIADGQNLVENDRVHYDEAYDERKGKTMADNVTGGSGGPAGESGGGYGGGKGYGGGGKGYGGGGGGVYGGGY